MSRKRIIPESELILTEEGEIYHLNLLPEDLADIILTVGDPERVESISKYFDKVEIKKQKREFVVHTGWIGKQRLSVISTGIGTDNIDIILNELDALANIDFKTRQIKANLKSLRIIRVGTCGGLQPEIEVDSFVVSTYGMGFDNMMRYYNYSLCADEERITQKSTAYFQACPAIPYVFKGDAELVALFAKTCHSGITATFSGFYGPQMRMLRGPLRDPQFMNKIQKFKFEDLKILNFEMETAGIYGLGKLLNHHVCAVSVIIANRATKKFTKNVNTAVEGLIQMVIDSLGTCTK